MGNLVDDTPTENIGHDLGGFGSGMGAGGDRKMLGAGFDLSAGEYGNVYVYVYVYVYVCGNVYIYDNVNVCGNVYIYVNVDIYVYVYGNVYIYVNVNVDIYVYV